MEFSVEEAIRKEIDSLSGENKIRATKLRFVLNLLEGNDVSMRNLMNCMLEQANEKNLSYRFITQKTGVSSNAISVYRNNKSDICVTNYEKLINFINSNQNH